MPLPTEIVNNSADKYTVKLETVKKEFQAMLMEFVKELESKDGKILDTNENLEKVLAFNISEALNESGYANLVGEFIGEVPELLKEI